MNSSLSKNNSESVGNVSKTNEKPLKDEMVFT